MNSLRARMVVLASLVVALFIALTAVALDRAFQATARQLLNENLQAQVFALLAAATVEPQGELELGALAEPRFSLPGSGLYALVNDANGKELWRSTSLLDHQLPLLAPDVAGQAQFYQTDTAWSTHLFLLAYRVRWETSAGNDQTFDLYVGQTRDDFDAQVERFRANLWRWLIALGFGLLATQALVLHIGLMPLRRLAQQVSAVERGKRETLSDKQPAELHALTSNMNHLISFGRSSLQRHRNALADLAHALKTPLAVLRGAAEDLPPGNSELKRTLNESVQRMDEAISYRLRHASTVGSAGITVSVAVADVGQRLRASFLKVYADKNLSIEILGQANARIDEGDLTELLGNLMDNACKWASHQVKVQLSSDNERGLVIVVEDDGRGISAEKRTIILERGVRADEHTPGQGLGLALVHELVVNDYQGRIELGESSLGGAKVAIYLLC